MKLTFGKHKGKELSECPLHYLFWLAGGAKLSNGNSFTVPQELINEAKDISTKMYEMENYVKHRLNGKPSDKTEYVIERLGDISGETIHGSLEDALKELDGEYRPLTEEEKQEYGITTHRNTPDPEDDRILIWEVLPSGHKKVVWHFSGWHWDSQEFYGLGQGTLLGDEKDLCSIALEDM
jgi:hypothetical protein